MRAYRRASKPTDSPTTEAALAAMDAEELRDLIREMIPWLDESTHARLVNGLVDRAARSRSGWAPPGPTNDAVGEILHFAEAAKRVGYADPSEVDDYLRQGSNAFLGKDYRSAYQIFRALLVPIGNADVVSGEVDNTGCPSNQGLKQLHCNAQQTNREHDAYSMSYLFRIASRAVQDRLSRYRIGTRQASAATAPRTFRGSYNDENATTSSRPRAAALDRFPTGAGRRQTVAVRVG